MIRPDSVYCYTMLHQPEKFTGVFGKKAPAKQMNVNANRAQKHD